MDKTGHVLYHHFSDIAGSEWEIQVRQELLEAMDRLEPWKLSQSNGPVVPIPSTSELLGALKGGVELTFTYKNFTECNESDAHQITEFCESLALVILEERRMLEPSKFRDLH